jgi:hypothetical protein
MAAQLMGFDFDLLVPGYQGRNMSKKKNSTGSKIKTPKITLPKYKEKYSDDEIDTCM